MTSRKTSWYAGNYLDEGSLMVETRIATAMTLGKKIKISTLNESLSNSSSVAGENEHLNSVLMMW